MKAIVRWCAFLLLVLHAAAIERSYWVWHRSEALSAEEKSELQRQGVTTLYWQAGTIAPVDKSWRWSEGPRALKDVADGFHVVPVVRIESAVRDPFAADLAALRIQLARVARDGAVQIDFDCPDRLLANYAAVLAKLREDFPKLSITALAHWPSLKDFPVLARSIPEMCPMFYDLQADPTEVSAENLPPPLLDPAQIQKTLEAWKKCPTKWRAGLPTFARLTVFDRNGYSRGQIPDWLWEDVSFHKHLHAMTRTNLGVTLLRTDSATKVATRALEAGDMLAVRTIDRAALAQSFAVAEESGAAGVVLFRLPGRGDSVGHSLPALGDLAAAPKLTLQRDGDALILKNTGIADLAPRLSGERHDRDRAYALEIDAPAAVFREAEPGAFWRVTAHVNADTTPRAASVRAATRLTFWLSHLPAGASIRSGIFQLAPAADARNLRWRIVPLTDWQPLP